MNLHGEPPTTDQNTRKRTGVKRWTDSFLTIQVLLAILLSPLLLLGQRSVMVAGVVEDERGAAIPGAKVTLVNQDTKQTQETTSGEDGNFSFKDVPPGNYQLKAEANGFEPDQRVVTLGPQELKPLKIKLKVGTVKQQLIVQADPAEELSTSDSDTASTKFDDDLLGGLPTPSEDILSLIGKFVSPAAQGAEGTSIVVDGVEGGQIDVPSSAIRRVRINRNPYSAAYQRPGRGRAEITLKRGHKSRFDGSFAVLARNSVFDARNAFAKSKPDLNRRLLQASIGGPLPGKRASFYLAGQRLMNDESAVVNAVTPAGPFNTNVPTPERRDRIFTRLQWWPTALHTLSASYTFRDQSLRNDDVGGFNLPEQGVSRGDHEHKVVLSYSALLSGTARNDLLFSFKKENERTGNQATTPAIVVNQAFTGGPSQSFLSDEKRSFELQNTATYIRGRHSLLFGARFRTDLIAAFEASNFGGTFEFASLAQFTAGAPFVFRVNQGDPNVAFTMHIFSAFLQDEFRLRPNLTLLFGLRYEWQSTTHDRNNFAPRFGFAFAPGKSKKTVVTGGAGIFYDTLPRTATQQSLLIDGVQLREVVIANPSFPNPFLSGQVISPPPSVVRLHPNTRSPYLLSTSIGVERELWRRNSLSLEYSYLHGVHLFRSRDVNAPLAPNGLRPNPNFLNIQQIESSALLQSQALTVTYRGRIGKSFKPYAQYVLSKSTNNTFGTFSLPANNYDLRPERGPADFDRRHRFNLAGVLALPRGYQLGSLLSVASGAPFDITTGFDNNGDTVANDRPPGVSRNTGRGPGSVQLDLRFTKAFNISRLWGGEQRSPIRHGLELSADAFNATNHTNVTSIVGVQSSPFFGRANSATAARTFQFSLKYLFSKSETKENSK